MPDSHHKDISIDKASEWYESNILILVPKTSGQPISHTPRYYTKWGAAFITFILTFLRIIVYSGAQPLRTLDLFGPLVPD